MSSATSMFIILSFEMADFNKIILAGVIQQTFLSDTHRRMEEENILCEVIKTKLRKNHIKNLKYFEEIIPRYSSDDFKSHFRMTRQSVEIVMESIGGFLQNNYEFGRPQVPFEKQVLMTLWFLGNNEVYRSIADRFNVSVSTLHRCVYAICDEINNKCVNKIKWPNNEEMMRIIDGFQHKSGFPGVVGCIDGTHIRISKPKRNPDSYVNRKGFHSLHLQGICDNNKKFIHVLCGWPGSVHDARVFNNCEINEKNFSFDSHLIGDSAYPLKNFLMTPFKDNGRLTKEERLYNKSLSGARIAIEHTFGLLKVRFRILLGTVNAYNTVHIPKLILTCCILHNMTIDAKDLFEDGLDQLEYLEDEFSLGLSSDSENHAASLKRNYICSRLQTL